MRNRLSSRQWVLAALLVPVALVLAWLGFRATVLATFPADSDPVEQLAPDAPERVSRVALNDMLQRSGVPGPEWSPRMPELARQRPLDDLPFLYAGAQAAERGQRTRARTLLEEARRRAPRQRATRLLLMREYLLADDLPATSREMETLIRLLPPAADLLVKTLAPMVLDPKMNRPTVAVLKDNKPLAEMVLKEMVRSGAPPSAILRLAQQARVPVRAQGDTWRSQFVNLLITRGNAASAALWWQRFNGITTPRDGLLDPEFRQANTLAPFGWALVSDETGTADAMRRGGLSVDFYGRRSGALATQVATLSPGRYRISFNVEGNAAGIDSYLAWTGACVGTNRVLFERPIREVKAGARTFAADFQVPAIGCSGQLIRLQAIAGEFPVSQTVDITNLSVRKLGATAR